MPWYDKPGGIPANTVYCDGVIVARDVTVTLPEVTASTVEIMMGGPQDLPITGHIESMELSIAKNGVDVQMGLLMEPRRHMIEVRAVQDKLINSGEKIQEQIKAFLGCVPTTLPGIELTVGEISENELTFSVLRYQLYVNNREVFLVDKPNNILRANGTDFARNIESML